MSEQNKATARRFYEAWTSGDLDAYDEILASDAKDHDTQNPNGALRLYESVGFQVVETWLSYVKNVV